LISNLQTVQAQTLGHYWLDIYVEFVAEMRQANLLQAAKRKNFAEPTFLKTSSPIAPFLPIDAISVTIEVHGEVQERVGPFDLVEFALKDLEENVVHRARRPLKATSYGAKRQGERAKSRRR